MSDKKPKKKRIGNSLKRDKLKYGEAYRTTKKFTWSNFDNKMRKIEVPADELLIYRISKPTKTKRENVMFVWVRKGVTVCLSTSEDSILFLKHMEWEDRHRKLDLTEREDDTKKIKTQPRPGIQGQPDSESAGRKPVDS